MYLYIYISATVISGPDDITVCEGRSATFTCVLQDSRISSDDVQWYRYIIGTNITEWIDQKDRNIHFTTYATNTNIMTSNLTISNAIKSYTGNYWVGTPNYTVCRAYLTVAESKYIML